MPISAAIAPNIHDIQSRNFSFDIVFSPPMGEDIDDSSFTLDNIRVLESNHISKSNLKLMSFMNNVGVIMVILPEEVNGSFEIHLTGIVEVDGKEKEIIGDFKIIKYRTIRTIRARFG